MKHLAATCALCLLLWVPVIAGNQLYTGDASTVPVGKMQFQLYQDSTPSRTYRFGGTSLTYGASPNVDVKAAYGRLWSDISPEVKIGPNIGFKWRFVGDGRMRPSAAVSALYSKTDTAGAPAESNDYGALLILSYPSRYITLLGNVGRVWVEGQKPDLYYLSFAAIRYITTRTLFALEYSDLERIGSAVNQGIDVQYAAGIVYSPDRKVSYSLQLGYLPNNSKYHIRTTLGFSIYF